MHRSSSHSPRPPRSAWSASPERAALLALYAEVDALLEGRTCACSSVGAARSVDGSGPMRPSRPAEPVCCHFAVTGREPYPTAVELTEVLHAMRATPLPKRLPLAELRACPLLSATGRCGIYASRPFGCRTFFCADAQGPVAPRDALGALGRRVADLSARHTPRDPGPRPLVKALAAAVRPRA